MSEQTALFAPELPPALLAAFRAAEAEAGVRPARFDVVVAFVDGFGGHWIELRANGRKQVLCARHDLEVAGRDLFNLVHGTKGQP